MVAYGEQGIGPEFVLESDPSDLKESESAVSVVMRHKTKYVSKGLSSLVKMEAAMRKLATLNEALSCQKKVLQRKANNAQWWSPLRFAHSCNIFMTSQTGGNILYLHQATGITYYYFQHISHFLREVNNFLLKTDIL